MQEDQHGREHANKYGRDQADLGTSQQAQRPKPMQPRAPLTRLEIKSDVTTHWPAIRLLHNNHLSRRIQGLGAQRIHLHSLRLLFHFLRTI